ncbi:hypothetical protein AGLY_015973, partial [Aphis glycines]
RLMISLVPKQVDLSQNISTKLKLKCPSLNQYIHLNQTLGEMIYFPTSFEIISCTIKNNNVTFKTLKLNSEIYYQAFYSTPCAAQLQNKNVHKIHNLFILVTKIDFLYYYSEQMLPVESFDSVVRKTLQILRLVPFVDVCGNDVKRSELEMIFCHRLILGAALKTALKSPKSFDCLLLLPTIFNKSTELVSVSKGLLVATGELITVCVLP